MKLKRLNSTDYLVYSFDYQEDGSISSMVDKILLKVKNIVELTGYYIVFVYPKEVGYFIHLKFMKDISYTSLFEYKINLDSSQKLYFKTEDYFLLSGFSSIYYYDGVYYGLVESSCDKILEMVEFGEFVLEFEIHDILMNSIII